VVDSEPTVSEDACIASCDDALISELDRWPPGPEMTYRCCCTGAKGEKAVREGSKRLNADEREIKCWRIIMLTEDQTRLSFLVTGSGKPGVT
jgi:hypothetical protein